MLESRFKLSSPLDVKGALQPKGFEPLPSDWIALGRTHPGEAPGAPHLFQTLWVRSKPKTGRALFVIHGIQEHMLRYLHLPAALGDAVDIVTGIDLRGHGRSGGTRGHVERFSQYVDDVRRILTMTQQECGLEMHLLGHSMGGLIGLRLVTEEKEIGVKSATLTSPALGFKAEAPLWKRTLGSFLDRAWGSFQVPYEVDPSLLSHDPGVAAAVKQDRLMIKKLSARWYSDFLRTIEDAKLHSKVSKVPVQFLLAGDDQIGNTEAVQAFEKHFSAPKKHLRIYRGMHHEMLNEKDRASVMRDVKKWITENSSV